MGDKSRIEWTDATWTPIRARLRETGKVGVHCERVSPACKNCYASAFNRRALPVHGTGLDFIRENREKVEIFVAEEMLLQPLRWKRPRKIFVCSQTDLFGEFVSDKQIDLVFAVMALAPQHTFQVLTKRPERLLAYMQRLTGHMNNVITLMTRSFARECFGGHYGGQEIPYWREIEDASVTESNGKWPLKNVWLGTTVETQEWAKKRIPLLLQTPAAKRFVSVEPMLGPVDLTRLEFDPGGSGGPVFMNVLSGTFLSIGGGGRIGKLDWVICGGESGHGARPMHPQWARALRNQCLAAEVPFFFKQWGAWAPLAATRVWKRGQVRIDTDGHIVTGLADKWDGTDAVLEKFGKRAAGRRLDGVEWSQFPGSL